MILEVKEVDWPLNSKPDDFLKVYRLPEYLVKELEKELKPFMPINVRASGLPNKLKILCTLSFLASGNYQKSLGVNKGTYVSQPSASRSIRQVVDALNHPIMLKKYLSFPDTSDERKVLKQRFYDNFKIPGVVGCVGKTLVSIKRPKVQEQLYYNRKGYHANNVLIINDADSNILHVDASHGGATHDSIVFSNSSIKNYLEDLDYTGEEVYLLGDSRYPQTQYLMTPYKDPEPGTAEEYYNSMHKCAWKSVEKTLTILKGRFRCLLVRKALHYDPQTVSKIVMACCILHNLCNRAGLPVPSLSTPELREEIRMLSIPTPSLVEDSENSQACRDELVKKLTRARDI